MDLILENVRMSFHTLWAPEEYKPGDGRPRYSAQFLITPGSPADVMIRNAIAQEIAAKFPDTAKATAFRLDVEGQKNGWCYMDGGRKPEYDRYKGMMILNTHRKASDGRPLIVDTNLSPLTEKDGKPYDGCYVVAKVGIYVQANGEQRGVRASFNTIQFAAHGEAFAGGAQPSIEGLKDLSAGADGAAMPAGPSPAQYAAPAQAPAPVRSNVDLI